jgi:hypothetical protein
LLFLDYFLASGRILWNNIRIFAFRTAIITGGKPPDGIEKTGQNTQNPQQNFPSQAALGIPFRLSDKPTIGTDIIFAH